MCAVGSRWCDDPRVIPPSGTEGVGTTNKGAGRLACGWGWFDQVCFFFCHFPLAREILRDGRVFLEVPLVGKHLFGQATLYDLQYYCVRIEVSLEL